MICDRATLQYVWREYLNDYLTVEKFAEHKGLTVEEANLLLNLAKRCHEDPHPEA